MDEKVVFLRHNYFFFLWAKELYASRCIAFLLSLCQGSHVSA